MNTSKPEQKIKSFIFCCFASVRMILKSRCLYLTGLSKFKEGFSKIQELLSLRKGINLYLQEIKMDLSRGNEKAIGVFVSGSETKQWHAYGAGFQEKPSVTWREWAKWKTQR